MLTVLLILHAVLWLPETVPIKPWEGSKAVPGSCWSVLPVRQGFLLSETRTENVTASREWLLHTLLQHYREYQQEGTCVHVCWGRENSGIRFFVFYLTDGYWGNFSKLASILIAYTQNNNKKLKNVHHGSEGWLAGTEGEWGVKKTYQELTRVWITNSLCWNMKSRPIIRSRQKSQLYWLKKRKVWQHMKNLTCQSHKEVGFKEVRQHVWCWVGAGVLKADRGFLEWKDHNTFHMGEKYKSRYHLNKSQPKEWNGNKEI